MSDTDAPEAASADVTFALTWRRRDDGLVGDLEAENVADRPVKLSGKPGLIPLDVGGQPLGAHTIVSLEFRSPGYAVMAPGQRVRSEVWWSGWDGRDPSGEYIVRWEGGEAHVQASGPLRPAVAGPATNLTSSWFTLVD